MLAAGVLVGGRQGREMSAVEAARQRRERLRLLILGHAVGAEPAVLVLDRLPRQLVELAAALQPVDDLARVGAVELGQRRDRVPGLVAADGVEQPAVVEVMLDPRYRLVLQGTVLGRFRRGWWRW